MKQWFNKYILIIFLIFCPEIYSDAVQKKWTSPVLPDVKVSEANVNEEVLKVWLPIIVNSLLEQNVVPTEIIESARIDPSLIIYIKENLSSSCITPFITKVVVGNFESCKCVPQDKLKKLIKILVDESLSKYIDIAIWNAYDL